ncbi:hypothetical protein Tco_1097480, partial [Tanacetum coccineum]
LWDPYYYRRRQGRDRDSGMVFIEPVFSFVFGDGDPNEGIEEQRWKFIGQYIGSLGGVVTAEELAPYLDVETAEKMEKHVVLKRESVIMCDATMAAIKLSILSRGGKMGGLERELLEVSLRLLSVSFSVATEGEPVESQTSRRSRPAAICNQSERIQEISILYNALSVTLLVDITSLLFCCN